MNYNDKQDIIKGLAEKMGIPNASDTRFGKSRYDSSTGTLYCEGLALPHSSLDKILEYYKAQMDMYKPIANRNPESMDIYMRNAVAYNAILMLSENVDNNK